MNLKDAVLSGVGLGLGKPMATVTSVADVILVGLGETLSTISVRVGVVPRILSTATETPAMVEVTVTLRSDLLAIVEPRFSMPAATYVVNSDPPCDEFVYEMAALLTSM